MQPSPWQFQWQYLVPWKRTGQAAALLAAWLVLGSGCGPEPAGPPDPARDTASGAAAETPVPDPPSEPGPESPDAGPWHFEHEGIAVDLEVTRNNEREGPQDLFRQGDDVTVAFRITDTTTGSPVTTLEPAAWLHPADDELGATEKVRSFLSANLSSRAEIDLNVFYVLALNENGSISVVDPLFSYGGSKLLAMTMLEAPGEDWVLSPDQRRLFVSMPGAGKVAVVDTATWKVVQNLDTSPQPMRVALQPDGRYLWVGCDGVNDGDPRSGVTVFDAATLQKVTEIPTGMGHHEIAFAPDDRWAYVTNQTAGTLCVVDVRTLQVMAELRVGEQPVSVDVSSLSRSAYVSCASGTVHVVDGDRHEEVARIEAEPGLGQLRFAPGGRIGLVVSSRENVVHVIDASSNRIVQTGDVEPEPDQITFTETLAYVRSRASELVLMLPLESLGHEGSPVPTVDFTGGAAPGKAKVPQSLANAIVAAPGGTAVLVANPVDQVIYYYREGMAAPMGQFKNYGLTPRATLVVDRSLNEQAPGVYATQVNLDLAGKVDVLFFLDAPRLVHGFTLEVEEDAAREEAGRQGPPIAVECLPRDGNLVVGAEATLRYRVTRTGDGSPADGLDDFGILVFSAGNFQVRQWASGSEDGTYVFRFTPPSRGTYYAFVQCPSQGLALEDLPPTILLAEQPVADVENGGASR